ncbi:MAG: hypothetical protein ACOC6C_03325 [Verrucomicrobiota bacterium]
MSDVTACPRFARDVPRLLSYMEIVFLGVRHPRIFVECVPEERDNMSFPVSALAFELKPQKSTVTGFYPSVEELLVPKIAAEGIIDCIVNGSVRDLQFVEQVSDLHAIQPFSWPEPGLDGTCDLVDAAVRYVRIDYLLNKKTPKSNLGTGLVQSVLLTVQNSRNPKFTSANLDTKRPRSRHVIMFVWVLAEDGFKDVPTQSRTTWRLELIELQDGVACQIPGTMLSFVDL